MECMQTKFGGHSLSGCGDLAPFAFLENGQISLSEHGPWGSKNRISSKNSEIDEIYVCTKFGGPGLSDYFCISSIKSRNYR